MDKIKNLLSRISWGKRLAIIAFTVAVLDQITKYLVVADLTQAFTIAGKGQQLSFFERIWTFLSFHHPPRDGIYSVIDNFWNFVYVENPGSIWGLFKTIDASFRVPFLLIMSIVAMIFLIIYFRQTPPHRWMLKLGLSLIFGGAIGNFLDRVRLGYVIDFIDWHWYDKIRWATFNVADAAISVGLGLLILDMIVNRHELKNVQTSKSKA